MNEKLIFNTARKIQDGQARDEYLRLACGNDLAVQERIRDLLAAHHEISEFLESPPVEVDDSTALQVSAPTASCMIGPYKLLQQIGEGGMGVVWMAEQQEPVKRRVALKLIRADMGSKEIVARFEAERQALAVMDHPNIARVLDAGTTDSGSPFFVMELVKGMPLNEFCDQNQLSIRERLELFVPICNAIQHAHQKGIIHRDLKPSNVLVTLQDGKPLPKVIDFGLAKALEHTHKLTDKTLFTEFGKVVGTLQYMSPEQAEMNVLDIDTRTDIYSLGVMLYELLTGSTPIEKESLQNNAMLQVLAMIRDTDPPLPSTRLSSSGDKAAVISRHRQISPSKLQQILRGDLDWVVMKAIDKDRPCRYETANGFAMDIKRFLNGEPVTAAPPSAIYRMKKFVRRNKAAIFVAATAAILMLLATGISTWQAVRASRAEKRALQQEAIANNINAFFQDDILTQTNPEMQSDRDLKLRTVLDSASDKIEQGRFVDQPQVEASIRQTISRSYLALGLFDKAETHLKRVVDLCRVVWGEDDPHTLSAMNNLSNVYLRQERYDKATPLKEQVLQISKRVLGAKNPDTLMRMVNLADLYRSRGNNDDNENAKVLLLDALDSYRELPNPPLESMLGAINNLAIVYAVTGDYERAETMFNELVVRLTKALSPEHPTTLMAKHNLGCCYMEQGEYGQAESQFLEVLTNRKKVLGPTNPDVAETLSDLCQTLLAEEKYAEAEKYLRECLSIYESDQMPRDSWLNYRAQCMLGAALAGQKNFKDAEHCLIDGYTGMKQREDKIPAADRPQLTQELRRIVDLYNAWHSAEPDKGYDTKASEWQKKLDDANHADQDRQQSMEVKKLMKQIEFGVNKFG